MVANGRFTGNRKQVGHKYNATRKDTEMNDVEIDEKISKLGTIVCLSDYHADFFALAANRDLKAMNVECQPYVLDLAQVRAWGLPRMDVYSGRDWDDESVHIRYDGAPGPEFWTKTPERVFKLNSADLPGVLDNGVEARSDLGEFWYDYDPETEIAKCHAERLGRLDWRVLSAAVSGCGFFMSAGHLDGEEMPLHWHLATDAHFVIEQDTLAALVGLIRNEDGARLRFRELFLRDMRRYTPDLYEAEFGPLTAEQAYDGRENARALRAIFEEERNSMPQSVLAAELVRQVIDDQGEDGAVAFLIQTWKELGGCSIEVKPDDTVAVRVRERVLEQAKTLSANPHKSPCVRLRLWHEGMPAYRPAEQTLTKGMA